MSGVKRDREGGGNEGSRDKRTQDSFQRDTPVQCPIDTTESGGEPRARLGGRVSGEEISPAQMRCAKSANISI